MILDIRFHDSRGAVQVQGVRMFTEYGEWAGEISPELVIHFYDHLEKPQLNIPLPTIKSFVVTND